jgi:RNA polymerase sigma factor (sigma-70 family)
VTPAERFIAELPRIRALIATVCRRHGVFGDDAEEFASWVQLRFVESDYAVFAKFEGRSSVATYLRVVVANLFLDYRNAQWGKWRPSAAAKRMGREAMELERLVSRDGLAASDAIAVMRGNGFVETSEDELLALAARLPVRGRPRRDESQDPERLAVATEAEDPREHAERRSLAKRAGEAVNRALSTLEDEDRLILRLRFAAGHKIVEIANALGVPAKSLYPRIERLLRAMRGELESAGIGPDEISSIYEDAYLEVPIDLASGAAAAEQQGVSRIQ